MSEDKKVGRVTLPAQNHADDLVGSFMERLRVDAIRDSDGTQLSEDLKVSSLKKYSTICLVRSDQEYAAAHPDSYHQKFLTSEFYTAGEKGLDIPLLEGYHRQKYRVRSDEHTRWWQVIDRSTGRVLGTDEWNVGPDAKSVQIPEPEPYHRYSVNYLVYQTWDSTSMYNHLTNGWKGAPVISLDPYKKETEEHLYSYFEKWLDQHDYTDVVRLTTLAYSFVLDSDEEGRDRYRDWTGYLESVSPEALEDFASETGIELCAEDFIQAGTFNANDLPPVEIYRKWMDFIQRFVFRFGKNLVDRVHKRGKEAAIFWGDHWVGVEPYGEHYKNMGLDIHIGACEDGVALRRLADCPVDGCKEIRLYPYFFPDVFQEGGDPLAESLSNWRKIRRAIMIRSVDRIGWGGYLNLAASFPEFSRHLEELADEFRDIKARVGNQGAALHRGKLAVVSSWGVLRSWINAFGRDQKFLVKRPDVTAIAGSNLLECLAGLPFDVCFLSYEELLSQGIPSDVTSLVSYGEAGSAWSGGKIWDKPELAAIIRKFVADGGSYLAAQEPSAYQKQGSYFQLSDLLGVDKEIGFGPMKNKRPMELCEGHFIAADLSEKQKASFSPSYVYAVCADTQLVASDESGQHIAVAAKEYGKGRSVYLSELPYSPENSRLLHRALLWARREEDSLERCFSENPATECHCFPEQGLLAVENLTNQDQDTVVRLNKGKRTRCSLKASELVWLSLE